jgi:hypothetical protein
LSLASSGLRIGVFILVIIAFIDIGYYSLGLPVVRHTIFEAQEYSKWTNKVKEPPIRGNGRVLYRDFNENLLSLRNYRLINGYTGGITPKKLLDYDDVSVLRIADVEWVFRRKNSVVGSSPRDSQPIGWKRVSNRLPRVRLVTNTHMSKFPARDIKKIDIKNNVLVTRPIDLEKDELGKAVIVRDKPGDIGIEVDTPGRQMLVLSESYNSEWRVFVDEKREKLYRINGDFMGCVIEKGEHKVRFVFVPMALTYGLPISILAISIALILCFMPLIARFISKRFCAQTD